MKPQLRIEWNLAPIISKETARDHQAWWRASGTPYVRRSSKDGPLAVVGGGPSIERHITTLQEWPGDIWAVNQTVQWCRGHGIQATLFSADADPILARPQFTAGNPPALFADIVDPALAGVLSDMTLFDLGQNVLAYQGTTATCAAVLGPFMGHSQVTFFGCDSCYTPERTHAYRQEERQGKLFEVIAANGERFATDAALEMQAAFLSQAIREFPQLYSEASGGLLRAMIFDPDWYVSEVSEPLFELLEFKEAA